MIDVDLLRLETLTAMIEEFKLPDLTVLNAGVFPMRTITGQEFTWDILVQERDIDAFEGRTSPAGKRNLQKIGNQSANLVRSFKNTLMPGAVLMNLRTPGTNVRARIGEDQVARELLAHRRLYDRQNQFMICQAWQGSLAMTIDGVAHTVDYKFAASHKIVDGFGVGATQIPVVWSDPAADMIGDIIRFKALAAEDSGHELTDAWTSSEVIAAMSKNDFFKESLGGTEAMRQAVIEGKVVRFQGLNWHAYDGTFKPVGGLVTRYLDKTRVVFTCGADPEIAELVKGTDVIPTDDGRGMREVAGRYSYARVNDNPASLAVYSGEVRLPVIYQPNAFVVAKVLAA